MPAYSLVGQYLISQLLPEINSKRALHIQGTHRTWEALVQSFRIQFLKYVLQLPPFTEHNDGDSPLDYWKRLSTHDDALILAYLAIKLFSIIANSMADERTGSVFTKINSPDRSNQSADLVVAMTQVLQHERRQLNPRRPEMLRFRDIPGLIKSVDQPSPSQPGADSESDPEYSDEEDHEMGPSNSEPNVTDPLEEPEMWEITAGLDEAPEPLLGGNVGHHEHFEVAMHDGIDLNNLFLLDLLSDTPVEEDFMSSELTADQTEPTLPYADIRATPTTF